MQGGTPESVHEIMLPYAGIIRIRFMGMISARNAPDTPAIIFLLFNQTDLVKLRPVLSR